MEHQGPPDPAQASERVLTEADALEGFDVWRYVEALRRRWWVVVLGVGLAAVVGLLQARRLGERFTAELMLQIQPARAATDIRGTGVAFPDRQLDVASELQVLRSLRVISQVVDSLGLQVAVVGRGVSRRDVLDRVEVAADAPAGSYVLSSAHGQVVLSRSVGGRPLAAARPGTWLAGPGFRLRLADGAALREPVLLLLSGRMAAAAALRQGIGVERLSGTTFVRLRYTTSDPELAAAVLNGVAVAYRDYTIVMPREESRRRRDFIALQLASLADSMTAAQAALQSRQEQARTLDPRIEAGNLTAALMGARNEYRTLRFREGVIEDLLLSLRSPETVEDGLRRLAALSGEVLPAGYATYGRLEGLVLERRRLTGSRFGRTAQDPGVELLDSLIARTTDDVRAVAEQSLEVVRRTRQAAEARVVELGTQLDRLPQQAAIFSRLTQRVEAVQKLFDALLAQYYQERIAAASEMGGAQVVDAAQVPLAPDQSRRRVLVLSLVTGFALGLIGALALDRLDSSVRDMVDAERSAGVPVIAHIPKLPSPNAKSGPRTAPVLDDGSPGAEAFRMLRTALRFVRTERPRLLAITSAGTQEGKTIVAINLAIALAQQGSTSLLIDADLRHPRVHLAFGIERGLGLSDVLVGEAAPEAAIVASGVDGLSVLPCGTRVTNPADLIGSEAFRTMIGQLATRYECIVLDTPPVLAVADPMLVSEVADGLLLVALANRTSRFALQRVVESLRHGGAPLLGIVLNLMQTPRAYRRYGGFSGYYVDGDRGGDGDGTRRGLARLFG